MKLTQHQHTHLKSLLRKHGGGIDCRTWLQASWRYCITLAIPICFIGLFLSYVTSSAGFIYFGCGVFLALVVHNFAAFRVGRNVWPVLEQVVDWKKVSELVESHEKDVA